MKTEYRLDEPPASTEPSLPRLVNRLRQKHWALLAALGESPTLNAAAARIAVTQPAATKMLADIETAFGFPLFDRHPRGLRATVLGEQVIGHARHAQSALTRFVEDLENKRRGGHGQLVIGAIMGAAPDVVAKAVARIKAERPLLNVRIVGETSDQIALLLERREIELAVGRLANQLQHDSVDFRPLANETMQVIVRQGHPLVRRRRALELADLMGWPWVLQPLASPARQLLEQEFAKANLGTPRNAIECSSVFAILQLLQSTDAVAVVSESVVRDHVRGGLLRQLPIPVGKDLKGFGVLTRKADPLSDAAAALVRHLHEVVR